MDLSIVIPVFAESKKIGADIEAASAFLQKSSLTGELIIVDDGSRDGTDESARRAGRSLPKGISLRVIRLSVHRGKGCAVRVGIGHSRGEYVMFADSGCCVPYENVLPGLNMLKSGTCDIAHGSRKLPQSAIKRAQPLRRRICAAFLRWFVKRILTIPPGITDTQCGFKIYRGDVARKLYGQCITDGFMFDMEVVMRAQQQGYRIKEFPIEWACDPDSRLSMTRVAWPVLSELLGLRRIKRTLSGK